MYAIQPPVEKKLPFEEVIVDLGNKSAPFIDIYRDTHPDPLARAKVPILELGEPGSAGYSKLVESGVVTQFIEKKWGDRGQKLSPDDPVKDAAMNLFIQMFMESVATLNFTIMAAPTPETIEKLYKSLVKGMKTLDNTLNQHGDSSGDYFLGEQFSLAEAMTAPFVVRMLANLPHHRGLGLLEICDKMELPRLKSWLLAVQARPSLVKTTPARDSLIQLAPYVRKGFCDYKLTDAVLDSIIASVDFNEDVEGSFKATLKEGNAMAAEAKKKRHAEREAVPVKSRL